MIFRRLLRSNKATNFSSAPPKWKVPEKKGWINIKLQIPKTTPKELFWQMLRAPFSTYFKCIGVVTVFGTICFGVQYFYAQYKLRTSDFCATALKTLENYPELIKILGTPLKSGHAFPYVKNGIQEDEVFLNMPLNGEKSNGILTFHAIRDQNVWIIRSMKFTFADRAGGIVRLIKDQDEK